MRWGEHLEFTAEAGPGDFIYVPPYVPHQEINASPTEALECVLCRSDGEAVAVNLDIEPVEKPEQVLWVDPTAHQILKYEFSNLPWDFLPGRSISSIPLSSAAGMASQK